MSRVLIINGVREFCVENENQNILGWHCLVDDVHVVFLSCSILTTIQMNGEEQLTLHFTPIAICLPFI